MLGALLGRESRGVAGILFRGYCGQRRVPEHAGRESAGKNIGYEVGVNA